MANLSRLTNGEIYMNLFGSKEDITKDILVFFFDSQCIYLKFMMGGGPLDPPL